MGRYNMIHFYLMNKYYRLLFICAVGIGSNKVLDNEGSTKNSLKSSLVQYLNSKKKIA